MKDLDLIEACKNGNLAKVKELIDKDACIDAKDNDGWTALMYALDSGQLEIAEYLLEKDANINAKNVSGATALLIASSYGHSETVKYLLEKGADINIPNKSKSTALIEASSNGDLGIVKLLLSEIEKRKKDYLNAQDNYGFSALMYASNNKRIDIAECLIENGADVNIKNKEGKTALDLAKNEDIKKLLEKAMGK